MRELYLVVLELIRLALRGRVLGCVGGAIQMAMIAQGYNTHRAREIT
jgi:hypothetical protein